MKKNEFGFAHIAILGIIILVLITSAVLYVSKSDKPATVNREATETESSLVAPLPADLLTIEKVKGLVAVEAPNVELTSIELEKEEGGFVYKIKLANGAILFFDARSGVKVSHDPGENEKEEGTLPAGIVATITFDKAREIALTQKPSGVIRKIELENEEGKVVYSVRFSDDARIDVDATNGAIVRTRPAKNSTAPSSGTSGSNNSGSGSSGSDSSHDDSAEDDSSHSGSGSSGSGSGHDDNEN